MADPLIRWPDDALDKKSLKEILPSDLLQILPRDSCMEISDRDLVERSCNRYLAKRLVRKSLYRDVP